MSVDSSSYKKSSFGPAFSFLEKEQREALAVYYAFCRLMDDIADEPDFPEPQKELIFWKEEIVRVFQGKPTTQLGRDIQKISQKYEMPCDRFLLLIEGMEADLQGRKYKNWEELTWYLWRVAGIVGLATLDILKVKGDAALHLAQDLGFAVQTTNIVRDVYDDVLLKRVYLPQNLLEKQGLSYEDVLQKKNLQKIALVLKELSQISKTFYAKAAMDLEKLSYWQQLPCRVMGCVYRANLAKIEKKNFMFEHTVKLNKIEKLLNCIYALYKKNFNC